jgi:nucleoside-diphosphate-sugar epimerase
MGTFFVTGASGFVGRHVVAALADQGHRVRCLSRGAGEDSPAEGMAWIRADLAEVSSYRDSLCDADVVIHLAGLLAARRAEDYFRTNVGGTEALLRACRESGTGARFVHVSTIAAMGPRHDGGLLRESDPCRPQSQYGASKLEAERVVLRHGAALQFVILRPAFIHGPGDTRGPEHLKALLQPRDGQWRTTVRSLSFCHVADVVRCVLRAAAPGAPAGGPYLVAEPRVYDWPGIQRALSRALEGLLRAGRVRPGPAVEAMRVRFRQLDVWNPGGHAVDDWGCDTRAARARLGFEAALSLERGASDAIQTCLEQWAHSPAGAVGSIERA